MAIKNCMEQFVREQLDNMLKHNPHICHCEKCREDMIALALNGLPSYYVTSDVGDLHTRMKLYENEKSLDIMLSVAKAMDRVRAFPRHEAN